MLVLNTHVTSDEYTDGITEIDMTIAKPPINGTCEVTPKIGWCSQSSYFIWQFFFTHMPVTT